MPLSKKQISRVYQAIEETERHQARELAYMDHLQNKELLSFYAEHLVKLRGMLVPAVSPVKFEGMIDVDGEQFAHYSGVTL